MYRKVKVHFRKRLSAYFGQSITMCGLRVADAEIPITKDWRIVTCKNCLKSKDVIE